VPAKFALKELKIEDKLICKINSQLDLETKAYYYEPQSGIENSGPIPPRVDRLTTYTVHWQITNSSNDLEDVRVWATLPQGISWSDRYINEVPDSELYYNERTKQVSWEIDKVPAGTGVIFSTYELIFQIGLTPSITQLGRRPVLINDSWIEAKDTFTEIVLEDTDREVNTSLPDDPKIGSYGGKVVE
jgi:hypothetical protein